MKKLLRFWLLSVLAMPALMALAGCNTTEGVARDVEEGADAVGDAARDATR
jgi:predicted small secreted protein